jgi:hypothetical protein
MAKMSKQARNREASAAYVVSSMTENRDVVVHGLLDHNKWLPQELHIDEATLRRLIEWLANTVHYKTGSMLAAEIAYVDEQADDPLVRESRDVAMGPLGTCMIQTRSKVDAVFGSVALATYGMREPAPRQAGELAAYAGTAARLLRQQPRTAPDGTGSVLDTTVLAKGIDEALAPLAQALSELVTEQRQLQGAMVRRDTEVDEWREVYVNGAAAFASLARMARQPELAQRVRPTYRRRSGREGAPDDGVSPDLPGDDDGAPGETPIVTPGPIVDLPGK